METITDTHPVAHHEVASGAATGQGRVTAQHLHPERLFQRRLILIDTDQQRFDVAHQHRIEAAVLVTPLIIITTLSEFDQ